MVQKIEKLNYDEVIESKVFTLTIKCNFCKSTKTFIGMDESDSGGYVSNVDIVCQNCGAIEGVF